ncbi:hypothetical protein SAMN05444159_6072 [Bradyrhizobium lablabi]|uniref:Uncharacterized protein n=1 Tax=Bradyrhizobium lablabi TaxID=722472 RepID=A0A1M7B816_9BRAD|nr:hypothetical protein SAMN05444159_6072 [Bradyrhizobium lablabi]
MRLSSGNGEFSRRISHLSPRAGRGRIALAIRVRGALRKRGGNAFKNARHISHHIVVPESQYAIVVIDKPLVPNRVARIVRVLSSIHLNSEATFTADQIDREWTDRLLPDKFVTVQAARAESIPESGFRFRGIPSQTSSALGFNFISSSHVEPPPHPDCFAIRPLPARGERLASPAIR